jgi:signal transduction histidine kinase
LFLDNDSTLLVGTQSGLDRITFTDRRFYIEHLTQRGDFFALVNSIVRDHQGNTLALARNGIVLQVLPATTKSLHFQPQLFIEALRINGHLVPAGTNVFAHHENNFVFEIAAPTFIDEKQVRFSYFLEGTAQSSWSSYGAEHATINIVNVPSGQYILRIRAAFPSTAYPESEFSYQFVVRPVWWKTIFAKVAMIVLTITCFIGVVTFYHRRKYERQKVVLDKERAVAEERRRIAGDLHDDLGAGLSSIRFLTEKMQRAEQSIGYSDITRIQQTSDELIDKMNDIIWVMSDEHDFLDDLLSHIRSYAAAYCDEHDLACTFRMPEEVPRVRVRGAIRRNVVLMIKESLHNIIKHAKATNVILEFSTSNVLRITVMDDGVGMDDHHPGHSGGHGLRNLKRRASDLGGTLTIMHNGGTMVIFEVPLQ